MLTNLSFQNRELAKVIGPEIRASTQAAAYLIYTQLKPANKKAMTYQEFHQEFIKNWESFATIEIEDDNE